MKQMMVKIGKIISKQFYQTVTKILSFLNLLLKGIKKCRFNSIYFHLKKYLHTVYNKHTDQHLSNMQSFIMADTSSSD